MTTPTGNQPHIVPISVSVALLSGAVAGFTVDVSLYPLDTIKTRLQSKEGFLKAGAVTVTSVITLFQEAQPKYYCVYLCVMLCVIFLSQEDSRGCTGDTDTLT